MNSQEKNLFMKKSLIPGAFTIKHFTGAINSALQIISVNSTLIVTCWGKHCETVYGSN
jgi:hypothetical protein